MRKVRIDLLCDWHYAVRDEEVPAVFEFELTLDRGRTKVVGVCDECHDGWYASMKSAFEVAETKELTPPIPRSDTPRKRSRPSNAQVDCLWPGCKRIAAAGFVSHRGMSMHMTREHGLSVKDWEEMTPGQRAETARVGDPSAA